MATDQKMYFCYSSIYPTRYNVIHFILSGNCSTCLGWYHHLSSGAQHNCIYSIWYLLLCYCYLSLSWTPPTAHSNQFQLFHDSDR